MNNWQQVSLIEATTLTEKSGFVHKQVDLFDEDGSHEFYKPKTGLTFKYKASFGDPMTFWIYPLINGRPVAVADFIKAVEES